MCSNVVVIASVESQDSAQMRLAQDDEMVNTLAPDRSDQPFGKAVLPRRGWCSRLVPDAHSAESARDNSAIDLIPIPAEVVRSFVPSKALGSLARDPFCGGVCRDVDPDEASAIEPHDDERIEQVESDGRDNKQVHRSNIWGMVVQEGVPPLAWRPAPLHHVFGDA